MIGKHRAYELLAGLMLFNAAIPVVIAMGFQGPVTGTENIGILAMYAKGLTEVSFWATITGIAAIFFTMSKVGGIHITFSTILFASVFAATSSPLHSILGDMRSAGWLSPELSSFVVMIYSIAFIVGLLELSR